MHQILNFEKNMKSFKEYLFIENENHNNLGEIMKLLWERYKPEILDFLQKISEKDPDIKSILNKINIEDQQEEPDIVSKNISDYNFEN